MKLTNARGLPQSVFEALSRKEYSRGDADISVTELINPPRIRVLKKRHDSEIELEAESQLNSFLGTCFHRGIEAGTKTGIAERRLSIGVNGWVISGGMDHYSDGVLTDYKTANKWKTMLECADGRIEEWENQLNVYAHILRANGHPVKKLMMFALFKDWNKGEFGTNSRKGNIFVPYQRGGYPETFWLHFEMALWPDNVAEAYVLARVKAHQDADKNLPLCTAKEIWKNANRCKNYCDPAKFCDQFKKQSETGLIEKEE